MALTVGGLHLDQLAVVHVTSYRPSVTEGGILEIPTTFDAIGGFNQAPERMTVRNSVHTALNGVVGSHMMGNWDGAGYAVVSPFLHALENNGPPAGFCTVDTYWALDAGTPLRLSQFRLIAPGNDLAVGELMREADAHNVFYKKNLDDHDRLLFLREFLVDRAVSDSRSQDRNRIYNGFLDKLRRGGVQVGGYDFYIDTEHDIARLEAIVLGAAGEEREKIDGVILTTLRDYAVHHALSGFSCPVKICGNDYWVNDRQNEGESDMAAHVGALHFGKHVYSAQAELEKLLNGHGLLKAYPLPDKETVHAFIAGHGADLPASSIALAQALVDSPLYAAATARRQSQLSAAAMPSLEAVS